MVDNFERGRVVASEWFADVERLVGLGAVEHVDPRDVPEDAVQPPVEGEVPHASIAEQVAAMWPKDEPTGTVVDPLGSTPDKTPSQPAVVEEPEGEPKTKSDKS